MLFKKLRTYVSPSLRWIYIHDVLVNGGVSVRYRLPFRKQTASREILINENKSIIKYWYHLTGFCVAVQNNIILNVFCVQPKNLNIVILTSQEPRQIYSSYSLKYPKCWCPTLLCPSVNCLEATPAWKVSNERPVSCHKHWLRHSNASAFWPFFRIETS